MNNTYKEISEQIYNEVARVRLLSPVCFAKEEPYRYPVVKAYLLKKLEGEVFVRTCWENILCRTPKEGEIDSILARYTKGELDKEGLILELRKSPEGISKRTCLVGLETKDFTNSMRNLKTRIKTILINLFLSFQTRAK